MQSHFYSVMFWHCKNIFLKNQIRHIKASIIELHTLSIEQFPEKDKILFDFLQIKHIMLELDLNSRII